MVAPFVMPVLLFLFLCYGDHPGVFVFALVAGFGVDVELLALDVWQPWIEAAFPEVIINLIQASGARLANLSRNQFGKINHQGVLFLFVQLFRHY